MSDQQASEKPKRGSLWGRIKGFIAKLYILIVTVALIHFILSDRSESYREFAGEIEQSVADIEIEIPELFPTPDATPGPEPTSTPEPLVFNSRKYGSDAFLPVVLLEPGQYRYVVEGVPGIRKWTVCGVRGLFSKSRDRFTIDEPCDLTLTISDVEGWWSITIEPEPEYQGTGW